jgi:hypothetical protein
MKFLTKLLIAFTLISATNTPFALAKQDQSAWSYLLPLAHHESGIGARPAGSKAEKQAAQWLIQQWQRQGYQATSLPFSYRFRGQSYQSQNVQMEIKGSSDRTLVIAAHYDSTGEDHGSLGATDNASGVAAVLALTAKLKGKTLPFNLRILAFGAEEIGLIGSTKYIEHQVRDLDKVIAMINLDTIIGGDQLYVHSADKTPYDCEGITKVDYNSNTQVRDALRAVSTAEFGNYGHKLHPAYKGAPEGVTGSWSDHAPFACSGIPIGYLEATNFAINGESGHDGYSQTEKTPLWDCYDDDKNTACDRDKERGWGMIWHTKFDRLDALEQVMPGRLQQQLDINVRVLERFVLNADQYLK